jgi:lipoate-protein ligase A
MLVEQGMRMAGEAYAIASNYLRRSGAIADNFDTSDGVRCGEVNRLKLANKAIAMFESELA